MIKKRPLQLHQNPPIKQWRQCHIVFITQGQKSSLQKIINTLNNSSVLTVSDIKDFIPMGGMINLVVKAGRIHPVVNIKAINRAQLSASAKLLRLATLI